MDVRKLMLLIGALVIAAVTAVMAKNMFTGASAPQAAATPVVPKGPEVLVATRTLPVGTIIDAEALRYQPWPKELVQNAYFIKPGTDPVGGDDQAKAAEQQKPVNPADLLGTVVRNEITAGQPLTHGALIKPGERGFLAAALGPGMRAVSVSVSATTGVGGFIFPGDRVDVMLSQDVAGDGAPLKVTETVLRNMRVLAVDKRTYGVDPQGKPIFGASRLVTFEATPKIAEKIQVAQKIGSLSLALRSIADNTAELERAIASGEVQVPNGNDPAAERRMMLAVAAKPSDKGTSYTVGAEVSRFQRASVPRAEKKSDPSQDMSKMMESMASLAARRDPNASREAPRPTGPVVRVARGNNVTVVPVGAK
nr:Flp pilus assembly protein CpaB [uncultured Sphingosinicella sp.]